MAKRKTRKSKPTVEKLYTSYELTSANKKVNLSVLVYSTGKITMTSKKGSKEFWFEKSDPKLLTDLFELFQQVLLIKPK